MPSEKFRFYLDAPRFGHKHWYGSLYPAKTKSENYLQEYIKHFNFIELNASFYRIPAVEQVLAWKKCADDNPDFKFCPKFSQQITHIKRLKNVAGLTFQFIDVCKLFGSQLGPAFLQISKTFGIKSLETVETYLASLPQDFMTHVEFQHRDWFIEPNLNQITHLLRQLAIGTIHHDTADRRDFLKMPLTTKTAFIRFQGNNNHPTDKQRLKSWLVKINQWRSEGLEAAYLTLNQPFEEEFPQLVGDAKKIFEELLDV